MTVKLFGYEGDGRVSRIYATVPKAVDDVLDDLASKKKLSCASCYDDVSPGKNRYVVSQLLIGSRRIIYQILCSACTVPIEKAIAEVQNAARARKQARPVEEATAPRGQT